MKILHRPTGIIRVVLTLILVIPYLLANTTATASATTTIASNEAGAANVTYTVNPANHEIDWQVRMTKEKSDTPRSMRLNLTKGARLTEVTDFAVTSDTGQAVAFTTERAGSSYRGPKDADAKQYLATFKTKYEEGVTSDAALTIGYDILEEANGQTVENVLTGEKNISISASEMADSVKEDQETPNVGKDESEQNHESSGDESSAAQKMEQPEKEDNQTDNRLSSDRENRVIVDSAAVFINGAKKKDINFRYVVENNKVTDIGQISYTDKVSFNIKWSWAIRDVLSYRTRDSSSGAASGWTDVVSGWWGSDWNGDIDMSMLGDSHLDQIRVENDGNGGIVFTNAGAKSNVQIQFKISGIDLFPVKSDWLQFSSAKEEFELAVPKLDFGTIDHLNEEIQRSFSFQLRKNTANVPITLSAKNEATGSTDNPFGYIDMLKYVTGGSIPLDPGVKRTIFNQQTNISEQQNFSVTLPDRDYAQTEYKTPITWELSFKK